ncbi:MAG: hypothetical protein Q4D80_01350 [Pseudomonadota bacterium]|nr:hypothetical protein [Pseudomonadota bacterium]
MESLWVYLNSPEVLAKLTSNRYFLILIVVAVMSLKRIASKSMFLTVFINLPGTTLHECAHFIVGLILNAKPVRFSLIPKRKDDHYVTGQVCFSNIKFYNAFPSAMAPLSLLILAYFLDQRMFEVIKLNCATYLFYVFLLTVIIENAIPSHEDFRQGFRFVSGVVLYAFLIIAVVALFY